MIAFPPVLGFVESIVGIIFFIIAFMGFISNLTKQNQEAQRRQQRRGGGGGARDEMQNEIDAFLKESRRSRRSREERPSRDEFISADEIEVVEESPRRRPPKQRKRTRTRQSNKQGKSQQQPTTPTQPVAVQENLEDHHIYSSFEGQEMPHLEAGLGKPAQVARISKGAKSSQAKDAVFAMVRSGTGIRNAILVNEILSKPAALRKSPN